MRLFLQDDAGNMLATQVDGQLYMHQSGQQSALAGQLMALAIELLLPPTMTERRVREIVAEMGVGAFYVPSDLNPAAGVDDIEGGSANG